MMGMRRDGRDDDASSCSSFTSGSQEEAAPCHGSLLELFVSLVYMASMRMSVTI